MWAAWCDVERRQVDENASRRDAYTGYPHCHVAASFLQLVTTFPSKNNAKQNEDVLFKKREHQKFVLSGHAATNWRIKGICVEVDFS